MPDVVHLVKLRVPMERTYAALTTAEGIRRWWTRDADLGSGTGAAGEFRFYDSTAVTTVRVEECSLR
jgi:uncharacterized protein YndB with AHSA1/START domain